MRRPNCEQKKVIRQNLISRDGYQCCKLNGHGCGKLFMDNETVTIDHIIPMWKNGTNRMSNLQLLCFDCHKQKSKKEHPYCIIPYMYARWVHQIRGYRQRHFLWKLVKVVSKREHQP